MERGGLCSTREVCCASSDVHVCVRMYINVRCRAGIHLRSAYLAV